MVKNYSDFTCCLYQGWYDSSDNCCLVQIWKLKFCQTFRTRFGKDLEVDVMKLNLGRDSEARFGQDFEV